MRVEHVDLSDKGWYIGPRNSNLYVSVGYANKGIDEPHEHSRITEIYLVARGTSEIRIEQKTIKLKAGDMISVEPGEAHTFLSSSPDYFHFVVHVPPTPNDTKLSDKVAITRERLGL